MTDYSMVKPTKYAGILFRSRLEARWAVFFDALGISWEYEPETFLVDNWWSADSPASDECSGPLNAGPVKIQYTPDFRIGIDAEPHPDYHLEVNEDGTFVTPDHRLLSVYAEVKPTNAAVYASALKISASIEFYGPLGAGLLLLGPVPRGEGVAPAHPILSWQKGVGLEYGSFDEHGNFRRTESPVGYSDGPELPKPIMLECRWKSGHPLSSLNNWKVRSAYDAARNERFGLGAAG